MAITKNITNKIQIQPVKPVEIKPKTENLAVLNKTAITTNFSTNAKDREFGGNLLKAQLNNQFDVNGNGVNPILAQHTANNSNTTDPIKVENAVKTIKDSLSQGFTDWDVTHGDLTNIQKTFKDLNPAEANEVFSRLSDDDLKNWVQELNGMNGGFSQKEKRQLFDDLSQKLSAENLVKLSEHLGLGKESDSVRPGQKNQPDVNILADSIARNAPDNVKAEYVKLMAAKAEKHQDAGTAVAQVLISLKNNPELLKQTLSQLSDKELQAVVDGAARKTVVNTRGGSVTNYDPQPLSDLLKAVSEMKGDGSAKQKARLFELAANKISDIRSDATGKSIIPFGGAALYYGQPAEDSIREGLTKVLDSDTTGVMTEMERLNRDGKGMTAYVKSMINSGQNEKLKTFIDKLQKGNDLNQNPLDNFTKKSVDSQGNEYFRNASVLGYFAGSLIQATEGITDDRKKQAEILNNVFGLGLGLTNTGKAGGPITGLTKAMVDDVVSKLDKGTIDLKEALTALTYPRDANGEPYEGAAEKDYDSARGRILDSN